MEGIDWSALTEDEKDCIREAMAVQAEENGIQEQYKEYFSMMEEVERRNEEFRKFYCTRDENLGDA